MAIEDDIFDLWHLIDKRMKWQLAGIWLEMEEGKLEKLEEEMIELGQEVLKELRAIHDSKDEATLKHHMKRLLKLIHHVKPTRGWQEDLQSEIYELVQEAKVAREAYERFHNIMNRKKEARSIAPREEQQKQPTKKDAAISMDTAFSILCSLIESNRNLVKFGVYSRGNVTGKGMASGGRCPYRYDPKKIEVIYAESYENIIPLNLESRGLNDPPVWEKQSFGFQDDNEFILVVRREILGNRFSQVVSDERSGSFYCVGISIARKGENYSGSEASAIIFVKDLFSDNAQQFMELMDRLADRYIHFYNNGIKQLEAEWRRKTGR